VCALAIEFYERGRGPLTCMGHPLSLREEIGWKAFCSRSHIAGHKASLRLWRPQWRVLVPYQDNFFPMTHGTYRCGFLLWGMASLYLGVPAGLPTPQSLLPRAHHSFSTPQLLDGCRAPGAATLPGWIGVSGGESRTTCQFPVAKSGCAGSHPCPLSAWAWYPSARLW